MSEFKTISEVAEQLQLPQHVLRFWETQFSQIKPAKRRGGRRFYSQQDVEMVEKIKNLLYTRGYTIKGAKKTLNQNFMPVGMPGMPAPIVENKKQPDMLTAFETPQADKTALKKILINLKEAEQILKAS